METIKNKLLEQIDVLKDRIEREDIQGLIEIIDEMRFEKSIRCSAYEFIQKLLIEFVSEHIKHANLDTFRVKRRGEYGGTTYDTYQVCKDGLYRNGHKAEWDSVGKLYQAYKYIMKKNNKITRI